MLTTNPLTGYGLSNLELLLLLVGIGVLMGIGYWLLQRHWHDEVRRRESALVMIRQQSDQLSNELTNAQQESKRLQDALAEPQQQREQLQGELAVAQSQQDRLQGDLAIAQKQCKELQSELVEMQRQRELDETRHRGELDKIRALYDPVRIKELLDHAERVIAHKFGSRLFDIAKRCRETSSRVRPDQLDLRMTLNEVSAAAHDMLQHTKLIAGASSLDEKELRLQPLYTAGVLQDVMGDQLEYANDRGVHPTRTPVNYRIETDRLLLYDLCTVVIENAIKYSYGGGVVEITQRLENETGQRLFIDVCDHGRGIEAKDFERIFELNVRGDGLAVPGSGLGLNYGRRVARRLGGDLVLVASNNEGSQFRIILPYRERIDTSQPGESSASPQPGEQNDSPPPDTA